MRTIDPNNLENFHKKDSSAQEEPKNNNVSEIEIKQKEIENSFAQAQENIDKSYSSYLKNNIKEDEYSQYKEQRNPVQSQINLPEDDPFKGSEVDTTVGNSNKRTTENLYANPFTYQGGVPGFLPNSPTRLKQQDLLASRHRFSTKDYIDKKLNAWNWGAFYFTWLWGLFNTRWYIGIAMIVVEYVFVCGLIQLGKILFSLGMYSAIFIPCGASLLYKILLGVFGNKISWYLKSWGGIENFTVAQDQWRFVAGMLYLFGALMYILLGCVYWHFAGFLLYIPGLIYLVFAIATLFVH